MSFAEQVSVTGEQSVQCAVFIKGFTVRLLF